MDYEKISADALGKSLRGIGLNILVTDVRERVQFLEELFGMRAFQVSSDFAIMSYGGSVLQLHADGTYHANPLLGLLPELPPRGAGIELRLFDTDPDAAVARARACAAEILQEATDKPHGLREAYILDADGYVWVPSRPL